ncbi:MAG TPA: nitroreductase [Ruminococcaceae bacterium]|nr:nitroreductase [Oscillospiraceae bacterium]
MTLVEAINARHSVRSFNDKKIDAEIAGELQKTIDECNRLSGFNIQLVLDEPNAFSTRMAHYGSFRNCKNYIAMIGPKSCDEKCGYYGEKIVLKAQQLGLNSCWVALSYGKSKVPCRIPGGQKLYVVIALGYGTSQGVQHKSKSMDELCKVSGEMPQWFFNAMTLAMLAPTAVNQQKFLFTLDNDTVYAKALRAFYSKMDLGIAKYHFEIGAGDAEFKWA